MQGLVLSGSLFFILAAASSTSAHAEPPRGAAIAPTRISGETQIAPDAVTSAQLDRAGRSALAGTFEVCVDRAGAVVDSRVLRSTSYAAYDQKIRRALRGWRYRPATPDDRPLGGCSTVTLVFRRR